MPLPEDYQTKLLAALQQKGVNPICEVCTHNDWAVV